MRIKLKQNETNIIVALGCGGTTRDNCTYLEQERITSAPEQNPCTYSICRMSSDICRIRLDFTVRDRD